jgi:serine/threonine protein phosphatase 1
MVTATLAPGRLPEGTRVYAIGDVHGCAKRLARLHALVEADFAEHPIAAASVVHIGDYVDRGEDSAGAIARLVDWPRATGLPTISLKGNHEAMALAALAEADPGAIGHWLDNGGGAALKSWSIALSVPPSEWARRIPAEHLGFMRGLPLTWRAGNYLFVHAGLRPNRPIAEQVEEDLLWIREPFLSSTRDFGAIVVHGHTPRPEPEVRANRIGIDTGAVFGGALTCLVLEANRLRFLAA